MEQQNKSDFVVPFIEHVKKHYKQFVILRSLTAR